MFKQLDCKTYFTFLGRNKLYTAINFFGLSVSLAMIVLISTYTLRQLGTDSQHENADRIYMVSDGVSDANGYYLPKYLLDRYPEIEAATSVASGTEEIEVGNNGDKIFAEVLDADAFELFKEKGVFDPETAAGLKTILESGSSEDPMVLFETFRGHRPTSDALLRQRGLAK